MHSRVACTVYILYLRVYVSLCVSLSISLLCVYFQVFLYGISHFELSSFSFSFSTQEIHSPLSQAHLKATFSRVFSHIPGLKLGPLLISFLITAFSTNRALGACCNNCFNCSYFSLKYALCKERLRLSCLLLASYITPNIKWELRAQLILIK